MSNGVEKHLYIYVVLPWENKYAPHKRRISELQQPFIAGKYAALLHIYAAFTPNLPHAAFLRH